VKQIALYAGIPDVKKVDACLDRCFELQEDSPDALVHKARVSKRQGSHLSQSPMAVAICVGWSLV